MVTASETVEHGIRRDAGAGEWSPNETLGGCVRRSTATGVAAGVAYEHRSPHPGLWTDDLATTDERMTNERWPQPHSLHDVGTTIVSWAAKWEPGTRPNPFIVCATSKISRPPPRSRVRRSGSRRTARPVSSCFRRSTTSLCCWKPVPRYSPAGSLRSTQHPSLFSAPRSHDHLTQEDNRSLRSPHEIGCGL